jgi:hypothetical protein
METALENRRGEIRTRRQELLRSAKFQEKRCSERGKGVRYEESSLKGSLMSPLPRRARWALSVCLGLSLALAGGCGSRSGNLLPVSGVVTLDGQQLEGGGVSFHPDTTRGNNSQEQPVGTIVNGKYELTTRGQRGAPPGWYKVVVISDNFSGNKAPPKGPTAELPKSVLHLKYTQPATTPLTREVAAQPPPHAYDLEVTR